MLLLVLVWAFEYVANNVRFLGSMNTMIVMLLKLLRVIVSEIQVLSQSSDM